MEKNELLVIQLPAKEAQRLIELFSLLERNEDSGPRYMPIAEAAEYCGVQVSTLHKACMNGDVAYYRAGKKNTFVREDLDRFMARFRRSSLDELVACAETRTLKKRTIL